MIAQHNIVAVARVDDIAIRSRNDDVIATVHGNAISSTMGGVCAGQRA